MGKVFEQCSINNTSTNEHMLNLNAYFEKIWSNHYKGVLRDHEVQENDRELIDFFVLPSITSKDDEALISPFTKSFSPSYIVAGSGFGKTTLMHAIILSCLTGEQIIQDCSLIKDGIKDKEQKYCDIREALLGSSTTFFPVFIDSNNANSIDYTSLLEIAEGSDIECFLEMVKEANINNSLLFLIDSIDEVDSNALPKYLSAIERLLSEYGNAHIVVTSRFAGNIDLPFEYNLLHLKELNDEDIKNITYAILTKDSAEQFLTQLDNNEYLKSLSKNPFALTTFLENKKDRILHHMIRSMVNAIIELRWKKHATRFKLPEDTILLLGFLACSYIFGNKMRASLSDIRQYISKINKNFKNNHVQYSIPKEDLEYFLDALSSQSGILNIKVVEHIDEYFFQDGLVACWLAANFINHMINETSEISERDGNHSICSNLCWLDGFVRSFETRNTTLSDYGVYTLTMALVMCSENNGQEIQMMFLYYLIFRDITSNDSEEQQRIAVGYHILINNLFGENDLTNNQNGEAMKMINRMLNEHKGIESTK